MSLRRLQLLSAVALLLAAAAPASALGAGGTRVYAPPGKAGATQYFEVVPNAGGGVAPPANLSTPSGANLNRLGQGRTAAGTLSHLGKTGAAAANWARASAPSLSRPPAKPGGSAGNGGGGSAGNGGGHSGTGAAVNLAGGSALSGFTHLLSGQDAGGIGAMLPLLLALSLAGAVGFALGRRLRRGDGH